MDLEIQDKDIRKILALLGIKNKKFLRVIAIVELFFIRAEKHHIFLLSAGISFNILLYTIPLLLVAIYIVNIVFGVESVTSFLTTTIEKILPPNAKSTDILHSTITEVYNILAKSSLAGWIGIITLIWLSSTLLSSLRTGLNTIFNIPSPQIFFVYKLKDILLIIAIALLVLLSSYIFPLLSIFNSLMETYLPGKFEEFISQLSVVLISLFSSFVLFYLLFRFVPNKRIPRMIRLISVFCCVVFIEISRHIFSWYINGVTAYGTFYGTYAVLALMAVWSYYLTLIIMFSAEFSQLVYDLTRKE